MKIKPYLLIIFLNFVFLQSIVSQKLNIGAELGYHWYNMNELKDLNDYTLSQLPFEAKITENFPPYFNYSGFLMFNYNNAFNIGFRYTFNSTGSRISRSDYSGEYLFDTKVKCHAPSIIITMDINKFGKFSASFMSDFGITFSSLDFTEEFNLYQVDSVSNNYSTTAKSFFWEPSFLLAYPISFIDIGFRVGYQIDFVNFNPKFLNTYGIKPNWSGLNFAVSVSHSFDLTKD